MYFHDFNFLLLQILVRLYCYLNHENQLRIAEVKHILVQKGSNSLAPTISLFSVNNASRFPLPNCQSLTNLNFEISLLILISLAQNPEGLIFEHWLAPSWVFFNLKLENRNFLWFFRKHAHFWGGRGGGFFFFFFKLCCPQSYYDV